MRSWDPADSYNDPYQPCDKDRLFAILSYPEQSFLDHLATEAKRQRDCQAAANPYLDHACEDDIAWDLTYTFDFTCVHVHTELYPWEIRVLHQWAEDAGLHSTHISVPAIEKIDQRGPPHKKRKGMMKKEFIFRIHDTPPQA